MSQAKYSRIAILIFLMAGFLGSRVNAQEPNQRLEVDFDRQVKPILSDRCFFCHGPDSETREADLRLDVESGIRSVVASNEPEESELYLRIVSHDDDRMPPEESKLSLTDKEQDLIKRWIEQGARWNQHWSFVAPRNPEIPKTPGTPQSTMPIDAFILARLQQQGLALSPSASKEKLIRRVTFDLTGLPPTIAEIDAYVADPSPEAYANVVDRLLATDRYGERMASDWLDIARYSDTYGYQVDRDRHVWPWRDWVIRAFNQNMHYDDFITEQLAGDLLKDATDDQILATTFNRLHPQKVEGGSVEEEFRVEYVADRSQTVGMAFMGLTIECARCHDHKFDPISQKEYYQLFAFFNNIDESGLYSYYDPGAVPTPTLMLADDATRKSLTDQGETVANSEKTLAQYRNDSPQNDSQQNSPSFHAWVSDLTRRQEDLRRDIPGLVLAPEFKQSGIGNNTLTEGPLGSQALRMTGDDEIKLKTGSFKRHQPFTIAIRMRVPTDEALLKRAVVFHRTGGWTDSASRGYQMLIKDGRLTVSLIHFWPGNAISIRTQADVKTNQWLHVAMVYDGSSRADGLQIFIDGKPAPTDVVRDHLQKTITGGGTDHLVLGARSRDTGFKGGELADVRVFDRELSSVEIARLNREASFGELLGTSVEKFEPAELNRLAAYYLSNHDAEYGKMTETLATARQSLNATLDRVSEIMVMRELSDPRPAFVLGRGSYDARGELVRAQTPEIFPPMPADESANRLGLARWLTAAEHPLTARVAVNHYWQLLFGNGLVRTPEDFGSQGEPPTHPELLDYLAVDFQSGGWDLKRLIKAIVLTRTYRQSTKTSDELLKLDPDNRLLARAPTFRLPAEMLRDNVLATSGLLVENIGGPPVRPYELAVSFKPSAPDKGNGLYRRSLYTYWKRTGPAPVMLTLDAAKRDVCQVKRERTSSPLASLVQLNNPQTVEASRALAEKLMNQYEDRKTEIVIDLFRKLTSRVPSEQEQSILEQLFDAQLKYFSDNPDAAKSFLGVGDTGSTTDQPAALAAWASVVNTLFSFDECVMKR